MTDDSVVSLTPDCCDVIDNTRDLSQSLSVLYRDELNSDVVFKVEDELFKAHRLILAMQSPVFRELLLGTNFRESKMPRDEPIELPEKKAVPFHAFLLYLYSGRIDVAELDLTTAIDVLLMADEFQVEPLVNGLGDRLKKKVAMESVFTLFEAATALGASVLLQHCRDFMCQNGRLILKDPKFLQLSERAMSDLLASDNLAAPEIEILVAVSSWYASNPGANLKNILKHVRFELVQLDGMTLALLAPLFKLFASHDIDINILMGVSESSCPRYRRFLETENLATPIAGAIVLPEGGVSNASYMIDGSFLNRAPNNMQIHGYETNHKFGPDHYIMLKMPRVVYVSSMMVIAANSTSSSYHQCPNGFRIETSVDKKHWQLLAESNDPSNSMKRRLLMFRPQHLQYVKFTGKCSNYCDSFSVLYFECPANQADSYQCLYQNHCPNGGTLMYEVDQKRVTVFGNVQQD